MTNQYFETPNGRRLAYRYHPQRTGKTYVWLPGFKSDMAGTKVTMLEDWAKSRDHGFLAFDYSGHGKSDGAFEDGTISAWREDTLDIIEGLTEGPLVLVGSSMGGWLALLAALALPGRIQGLVLIAPAPDFTEKLMWPGFAPEVQRQILETGKTLLPSEYGDPYPITRALIEDGRQWSLLDGPIQFDGPVRVLQGIQDADVPWRHALRLVDAMTSEDIVFTLIKDGDHRLSRDEDIARLIRQCERL